MAFGKNVFAFRVRDPNEIADGRDEIRFTMEFLQLLDEFGQRFFEPYGRGSVALSHSGWRWRFYGVVLFVCRPRDPSPGFIITAPERTHACNGFELGDCSAAHDRHNAVGIV